MPIKINDNLPASDILHNENIFVMNEKRAYEQDIRPLKIVILNLMPLKIITETQILRLLGNSPLQVDIVLLHPSTYTCKNTSYEHLIKFYNTFDEIKDQKYDGMIITGSPVENLRFEDVIYWEELKKIFEWKIKNVISSLYICWGAQAALNYYFDIPKYKLNEKLSGVFTHYICQKNKKILRGFDD